MTECWVNVYGDGCGQFVGMPKMTRPHSMFLATSTELRQGVKTLYRLHVRMKPKGEK